MNLTFKFCLIWEKMSAELLHIHSGIVDILFSVIDMMVCVTSVELS